MQIKIKPNKILRGDILEFDGVICHQVNCKRVAGKGLAKQIRKKYPEWYDFYCSTDPKLGLVTFFETGKVVIASLYSQYGYGVTKRHTSYDSLVTCLRKLDLYFTDKPVYIPYGIGCGLGGGDWHIVKAMIEVHVPKAIIVKLEV